MLLAMSVVGCKSSKSDLGTPKKTEQEEYLVFLDKSKAEIQIVQDKEDGFFQSLSMADMSIQLKKSDMPQSGGEAKLLYQDLLKSEMQDFTESEMVFMNEVFDSVETALKLINPKLIPPKIELIKTKINHYGPNVYYTREDAIILPDNIFTSPSVDAQVPVMLHEIFHILSRYDEEFRDKMYALIGFEKYSEDLVMPKEIFDRILTNPDGVSREYAITLKDENGVEQKAIPLILSSQERFKPSMSTFFAYLSFDLYPLVKIAENQVTLGLNSQGASALSVGHNANFFQQIKDNTQYIIHPDEIMADNFMMAVLANKNGSFDNFSEEGTQLLKEVLEILKTYEPKLEG